MGEQTQEPISFGRIGGKCSEELDHFRRWRREWRKLACELIMELDLRTVLGTAWIALKGWADQEVWDTLHPALKLGNSLRRNDALLPILLGLHANVLTTGRAAESLRWVTQIQEAAEARTTTRIS